MDPEDRVVEPEIPRFEFLTASYLLEQGGAKDRLRTESREALELVRKQNCEKSTVQCLGLSARLHDEIARLDDQENRLDEVQMIIGWSGSKTVVLEQAVRELNRGLDCLWKRHENMLGEGIDDYKVEPKVE